MTRLANFILVIGVMTIVAAVGWWLNYYGGIANDTWADLQDVFPCLYSTGGRCAVVRGLSRVGGGTPYQPMVLWIGAGIFVVGTVLRFAFGNKR